MSQYKENCKVLNTNGAINQAIRIKTQAFKKSLKLRNNICRIRMENVKQATSASKI